MNYFMFTDYFGILKWDHIAEIIIIIMFLVVMLFSDISALKTMS